MKKIVDNSFVRVSSGVQLPPLDVKEILRAVKIVAKEEQWKVTLKYSTAAGAITGTSAVIGGLALTPIGLTPVGVVVGTAVGSITSFALFRKKYISLVEIIDRLSNEEKIKLAEHLRKGFEKASIHDAVKLFFLLTSKDRQIFELIKLLMMTYKSGVFEVFTEDNHSSKAVTS